MTTPTTPTTPAAIARECAEKLNSAFNLYAWEDSKEEAYQLVLAAITAAITAARAAGKDMSE